MSPWTKGAEARWNEFSENALRQLSQGDLDPDEVLEDMRRHVETELNAQSLTVVTADDLNKILVTLQLPEASAAIPDMAPIQPQPQQPAYQAVLSAFGGFYIITFGVLLPLGAIFFELATRICADFFFNPLPTGWHILLFLAIPAANFTCYIAVRHNELKSARFLGYLNSLSIGVAAFYTLWFIPILPFSAIATIFLGIGLCGLAPLLSLIACLLVRRRLRLMVAEQDFPRVPLLWTGLSCGFGLLVLLIVPTILAIVGLNMAISPKPNIQANGIRLLRNFSSKQYLLNRCYVDGSMEPFGFDITGTGHISSEEMRGVYYKVTGQSFNTQRPKTSFIGRRSSLFDDWDFEQAGDIVGGQLRDLSMTSSQIDANLDANAAVGYLEWIMTFQNNHQWSDREARCQIQLPPGGVVSRLTLWIDGKECEAAFGGRSQTKNAYKSVVRRQRDPVLVTTKGPDQVLMQCFPVPANGGKMKVRIGVSFPLDLLSKEQALLQLPYINERNFQMQETMQHQLWVEADGKLSAKLNLTTESMQEKNRCTIRGQLTNQQLETQQASIHLERNPDIMEVWAQHSIGEESITVLQSLKNNKNKALIDKAVIVIDTSKSMQTSIAKIESVIQEFKSDFDINIVTADDIARTFTLADKSVSDKLFRKSHFKGGKDNLPALVRAWDVAAEAERGAIIWIHSAQPHLFEEVDALTQRWNRRPNGPELIHVQITPGPNMIIEALDGIGRIRSLHRSASLEEDLNRLFGQLNGTIPRYTLTRKQIQDTANETAPKATSHVVRLWAKQQIETLRAKHGNKLLEEAKRMAVRHQLVTPVSGAVVLENQQQYAQNNLQPVDPDTVPAIPEPTSIALLGLGGLILTRLRQRKGRHLRIAS